MKTELLKSERGLQGWVGFQLNGINNKIIKQLEETIELQAEIIKDLKTRIEYLNVKNK